MLGIPSRPFANSLLVGFLPAVLFERDSLLKCKLQVTKETLSVNSPILKLVGVGFLLLPKETMEALLQEVTHYESQSKPLLSLPGRCQSIKI